MTSTWLWVINGASVWMWSGLHHLFLNFGSPSISLEWVKLYITNFIYKFIQSCYLVLVKELPHGCGLGHMTLFIILATLPYLFMDETRQLRFGMQMGLGSYYPSEHKLSSKQVFITPSIIL